MNTFSSKLSLNSLFLGILLCLVLVVPLGAWAEDSGGVETLNPADYENIGTPWGSQAGSLPQPPVGYPNGYGAYPQPAPQQPAPRRTLLGRLFAPLTKRMSPPIYQAPKYPKDKGLELQATADPLVRLAKGAKVAESTVNPGFYLLRKEGSESAPSVFLSLVQGSEVVARIPASQTTSEPPAAPPVATPPEPSGKKAKNKSSSGAVAVTPPAKTPKAPTAQVELSGDGQQMVLVYQQGQAIWKSSPVPVAEGWQH